MASREASVHFTFTMPLNLKNQDESDIKYTSIYLDVYLPFIDCLMLGLNILIYKSVIKHNNILK
jgi:hypothetical protein